MRSFPAQLCLRRNFSLRRGNARCRESATPSVEASSRLATHHPTGVAASVPQSREEGKYLNLPLLQHWLLRSYNVASTPLELIVSSAEVRLKHTPCGVDVLRENIIHAEISNHTNCVRHHHRVHSSLFAPRRNEWYDVFKGEPLLVHHHVFSD